MSYHATDIVPGYIHFILDIQMLGQKCGDITRHDGLGI